MHSRTGVSHVAAAFIAGLVVTGWAPASRAQCQSTEFDEVISSDVFAMDEFGSAVAVSGAFAMVGAPLDGEGGRDYGAVYVYRFDGASWNFETKLLPHDSADFDQFGVSVALSGDVAVIGSHLDDDGGQDSGSAYVFAFDGATWIEVAKLTSSDLLFWDNFGISVAIDGDVVVVGANLGGRVNPGAAYVFVKPHGGWTDMTETAKLTASDATDSDEFGVSVAVSGDVIVVGTQWETSGGSGSGAAYLFERPESGWTDMTETGKLTASDAAEDDRFGYGVSISGETVVVGAWGGDEGGDRTGSIYVFEKPPSGWTNMTETAKLAASDVPAHAHLGWSVAISGDLVVGGAPATLFDGTGAGAAYVFRRPSRGWAAVTEEAKLTASDGAEDDEFGYAVAINDGVTMIGARRHNTGAYDNSGTAYAYHGQSDCQPNDALDLCDLISGTSTDANRNGAPDECEGARGGAVDSLSMARADGASITLSWGRSCLPTDDDYEIYEGALGDFASHTPLFCTTGGATEQTFVPDPGGRYYLLVPRNAVVEGSYGLDSEGQERPQGSSVCLPRVLGVCP